MVVLTVFTVIWVILLVGALAVSLLTVWQSLGRIGVVLGEVEAGLRAVRDRSAPLGDHLSRFHAAASANGGDARRPGARAG